MSRIGKIARRTFLVGSVAIAGGVAFGVYVARKPLDNPLRPGDGEVTLNPYVLIDAQGVTVIAPRAEMGQGIHSTLAALVAEEMDLDWASVRVIHGPPAQAYYNGALMGAGLPYPDYSLSRLQQAIGENLSVVAKVMGLQVTGGSTGARDGFDKMRAAGASAREALRLAASNLWDIPVGRLRTENGQVIAPDGTALAYPALAAAAALIEAPQVDLRPASDWKLLGRARDNALPRSDMLAKATGRAAFAIDVRLPDMRFATLKRNPSRSGMLSFDPTAALAMPGVERVVDVGDGFAVAATNTWLAMQAAEAVTVDWAPAPYPATTAEMFDAIRASFDTKPNSTLRDEGDVNSAVEGTEITAEYSVPFLAHATMEPMSATALYTGEALTVWSGNQAPIIVRDKCAEAVGLPSDAVTLHTTLMGGGFGRRGEYDFSVPAALVAKAMPGVPVQVTWTREEDMRHDFYRPAALARFRGVVKDGEAVLLSGQIAAPSVTRSAMARLTGSRIPGADKGHVEGAFDQPYGIPNYRITGHLTDIAVPLGFWRSVGNSVNGFMFETFIDEMAHAAGRDPLEFRLQLATREHAPSAGVIEAVAEMSGWTGQTPEGVGRGVAFTYSFGTPVAEVVEVVETPAGIRISNVWIACDVGTALDPHNIEAQMTGGAVYGLSAAVMGEITFAGGRVEQGNFHEYDALRMHNAPRFDVRILETNAHMGGAGEPGTPPSMPALGNALFDLTGRRATRLPLIQDFDLLL